MVDSLPNHAARRAISAIFFVSGALFGGWLPHIPDVQLALHLSNRVLGLALLSSGTGAVVSIWSVGALIHRFGSRGVSLYSGIAACMIMPWLAWQHSLLGLALNLFAVGLCYGILDVGMNAHSVAVQVSHKRPILSAIHGWFSLGGFAGSAGAALAAQYNISALTHLLANSGVLLIVMVTSRFFLLPADVDKDADGPKLLRPHGILLLLGALCLIGFLAEGGILDWCAIYLLPDLGRTAAFGAIGTAVASVAMAVGRFLGDLAVHRFGHRKVLFVSGLMMASGIWLAILIPNPLVCIAGFAFAMLGLANMVPILFYAAGTLRGIPAANGLAAVTTCGYAGLLLGPPTIGLVADLRTLSFAIGMLAVLGLFVAFSSPRALPKP